MKKVYGYLFVIMYLLSCNSEGENSYMPISENNELEFTIPANFPEPSYKISLNPPTEKGFELGKKLFYDGDLASDGVVACGFCHIQDFAFTHHTHIVSHGVDGVLGTRNAQPLHNLAFMKEFTWDGAATHLDLQPVIPITAETEMNETIANVLLKLQSNPEYEQLFAAAFEDQEINTENMLKALSQFMVMMVSANSKFDKIERNEGSVFKDDEAAGYALFQSKCATCHSGTLFTDQTYRNNGLPIDPEYMDIGRERVTGLEEDRYRFKVPTLRNIELTYPYMHDGRMQTLREVLDHYTDGIVDTKTLDPLLRDPVTGKLGLSITDQEKEQIIAFLKTLTDDDFINDTRFSEF